MIAMPKLNQPMFAIIRKENAWLALPLSIRLLAVLHVMMITSFAFAGKPGGVTPPTTPAPVNYQLTWLNNIWGADWSIRARDMNDTGTVVGVSFSDSDSAAFAYAAGVMVDLNNLEAAWIDLDAPNEPTSGWVATRANKINQPGQIIGTARSEVTQAVRAFVLEFPQDSPPQFKLLPSMGMTESHGVAINDIGVAVAATAGGYLVYAPGMAPQVLLDLPQTTDQRADINNWGELVTGQGYYAAPDANFDYAAGVAIRAVGHGFYGISDTGWISGSREATKGKNGQSGGPVLRGPSPYGIEQLLASGSITDFAGGVNNHGDVCFAYGQRGHIYSQMKGSNGQPLGALALDDLISFTDSAAKTEWKAAPCTPWAINNRDDTGFGQVCGISGNTGAWRSFVLTPIAVAAP